METSDRKALEEEWLQLTVRDLPDAAERLGWAVRDPRCFQTVLLDNAFHGVWRAGDVATADGAEQRDGATDMPAHWHASDAVLLDAVTLARATLRGRMDIARLHRQSLRWRAAEPN